MSYLPPGYGGYAGVPILGEDDDDMTDDEFLANFAKEIAELMVKTGMELDKLQLEPDESFRERLERDIKAGAWDQIEKIVEKLVY